MLDHDVVNLSTRVRNRLRDEFTNKKLSQRAIAEHLTRFSSEPWTQVKVGRVLNGSVELKVDDVELLSGLAGLSLIELFREPGREFVADLTPSELRILNAMREHPSIAQHVVGLIAALTPQKRKLTRSPFRDRMRRDREDD